MSTLSAPPEDDSGSLKVSPTVLPVLESHSTPGSSTELQPSVAAIPASSGATARPTDQSFLWLRRSDQIAICMLVAILLVLLGMHWLRLSRWGTAPIELSSQEPREYYYSLDINSASWVEWAQLEGIGEKLARRIVADRDERGPFRGPADIGRVRGIGPKLLERIHPFLRGGTEVADDSNHRDVQQ
jgi:competence protein ComEA